MRLTHSIPAGEGVSGGESECSSAFANVPAHDLYWTKTLINGTGDSTTASDVASNERGVLSVQERCGLRSERTDGDVCETGSTAPGGVGSAGGGDRNGVMGEGTVLDSESVSPVFHIH